MFTKFPDLQNVDNSDPKSVASSIASISFLKNEMHTRSIIMIFLLIFRQCVKRGQITNAVVFMIAKDYLPLNTQEKTGFHHLMKVAPLHKVPSRKTIVHMIMINMTFFRHKIKIQVEALSLTADVWTDSHNSQSYLGLNGHCLYENKLMSIVFGATALTEPHNANYLAQVIINMTEKWGITTNKVVSQTMAQISLKLPQMLWQK